MDKFHIEKFEIRSRNYFFRIYYYFFFCVKQNFESSSNLYWATISNQKFTCVLQCWIMKKIMKFTVRVKVRKVLYVFIGTLCSKWPLKFKPGLNKKMPQGTYAQFHIWWDGRASRDILVETLAQVVFSDEIDFSRKGWLLCNSAWRSVKKERDSLLST